MKSVRADLQMHSTHSDGYKTVRELVTMLRAHRIGIAALTDHNTVAGVPEFLRSAKRKRIRAISGVEIYTTHRGRTLHLLGYRIDHTHAGLRSFLSNLHAKRMQRVYGCATKLRKRGYDIRRAQIDTLETEYVGYAALAGILEQSVKNRKRIREVTGLAHPKLFDAIDGVFWGNAPIRLSDTSAPVRDAIRVIRRAGGIPVLSHPGGHMNHDDAETIIVDLKRMGVKGIEVLSPYHTWRDIEFFQDLAYKHRLFMTMGSDYHGDLTSPYAHRVAVSSGMEYYHAPKTFIPQMLKGLHL